MRLDLAKPIQGKPSGFFRQTGQLVHNRRIRQILLMESRQIILKVTQIANPPGREQGLPALLDPEAALETSASHAVTVIPAASRVALTLPPILAGSFTPEIRSRVEHFYSSLYETSSVG